MIDLKRILIPCDFSDASQHALQHAAALARTYQCHLVALHVFPVTPMPLGDFSYLPPNPQLTDEVRVRLLADLKRFIEPASIAGAQQTVLIQEGDPVWEILSQAKEQSADLIVIGTHGRHGFQRWALGSVAEKVIHRAHCPVLTVSPHAGPPAPMGHVRFEKIIGAVDFSDTSRHALKWALDFATEMDAHLTVLHVLEGFVEEENRLTVPALLEYRQAMAKEALTKLKGAIPEEARRFCPIEERVLSGSAYKRILELIEAERADLVVMGAQGRSALDRLFIGSATTHVVRAASCPVLTVR